MCGVSSSFYPGINPPIRGSIEKNGGFEMKQLKYQSPYKGFNSEKEEKQVEHLIVSIPL